MKAFTKITAIVAPLDRSNVDTDAIIPKQFLKSIKRSGFGPNAFDEWRYLDHGAPGMDNSKRPLNPDFSLNQPRYQGAQILLPRKNFGCGSSREHAPWALDDYGFRAVIAPSFADIFFNNCYKTGLLPIVLTEEQVDQLFKEVEANEGYRPSSEIKMHIRCYEERDDVRSVVHAHPTIATGFTLEHIPLDTYSLIESAIVIGSIPITPFGVPSTMEVPLRLTP